MMGYSCGHHNLHAGASTKVDTPVVIVDTAVRVSVTLETRYIGDASPFLCAKNIRTYTHHFWGRKADG